MAEPVEVGGVAPGREGDRVSADRAGHRLVAEQRPELDGRVLIVAGRVHPAHHRRGLGPLLGDERAELRRAGDAVASDITGMRAAFPASTAAAGDWSSTTWSRLKRYPTPSPSSPSTLARGIAVSTWSSVLLRMHASSAAASASSHPSAF